jgi:hypothetical protein
MLTVHFRLFDPLLGSVYVSQAATPRNAWRLLQLAAKLNACEAWFFEPNSKGRTVSWQPGVGIRWGTRA